MEKETLDEKLPGLFEPDTLLPIQYFEAMRKKHLLEGEKRERIHVLLDLIELVCPGRLRAARGQRAQGPSLAPGNLHLIDQHTPLHELRVERPDVTPRTLFHFLEDSLRIPPGAGTPGDRIEEPLQQGMILDDRAHFVVGGSPRARGPPKRPVVALAPKRRIDAWNRNRARFRRDRKAGGDLARVTHVNQEIQGRELILAAHGGGFFRQRAKTRRAEDAVGTGLGREPDEVGQHLGGGMTAALIPGLRVEPGEAVRTPCQRTPGETQPQMEQGHLQRLDDRLSGLGPFLRVDDRERFPRLRHLGSVIQMPSHPSLELPRQQRPRFFQQTMPDSTVLMDGAAHLEHGSTRHVPTLRPRFPGGGVQEIRNPFRLIRAIGEPRQPRFSSKARTIARQGVEGFEWQRRDTGDQKR